MSYEGSRLPQNSQLLYHCITHQSCWSRAEVNQKKNTKALLAGLIGNLSVGLDAKGEEGDTALHLACLYGHQTCVERLLIQGASPNVRDSDGSTPLHDASAGGHLEIVRLVLAAAAALGDEALVECVNAQDGDGECPLHLSARGDHVEVVRQLLAAGAKADVKSEAGLMPYQFSKEGTEVEALCKPEGIVEAFE